VFAAIATFQFVRNKEIDAIPYRKKMLAFSLSLALIFSIAVAVSGDTSARSIANTEPEKFAAMEGVMQTTPDAPLTLGGITTPTGIKEGVHIPGLLSILVGGSRSVIITGLGAFDPSTWPPFAIHYYFDCMAFIGCLILIVPLAFFAIRKWRRRAQWAFSKTMSWFIIITGILSVIGVELGWMLTEEGRQPWTIHGILLTANAFTDSSTAIAYAVVFPILYIILAIMTSWILRAHYRKNKLS
jgi:cytochrome d ubiquinol oxidase subunit I